MNKYYFSREKTSRIKGPKVWLLERRSKIGVLILFFGFFNVNCRFHGQNVGFLTETGDLAAANGRNQ